MRRGRGGAASRLGRTRGVAWGRGEGREDWPLVRGGERRSGGRMDDEERRCSRRCGTRCRRYRPPCDGDSGASRQCQRMLLAMSTPNTRDPRGLTQAGDGVAKCKVTKSIMVRVVVSSDYSLMQHGTLDAMMLDSMDRQRNGRRTMSSEAVDVAGCAWVTTPFVHIIGNVMLHVVSQLCLCHVYLPRSTFQWTPH